MKDDAGDNAHPLRYLATKPFLYMLPRAVALQLMDPAISAGIIEHSSVPRWIWQHKARTIPPTVAIALERRNSEWSRAKIRFAHDSVHGQTAGGSRYHALRPETFFFQHATYVDALLETMDRYSGPLDHRLREKTYQATCAWYERYGISTRIVPPTLKEFDEYMVERVSSLSVTPALTLYRSQLLRPRYWYPAVVPTPVIRSFLHSKSREILDAPKRAGDDRAAELFIKFTRRSASSSWLRD